MIHDNKQELGVSIDLVRVTIPHDKCTTPNEGQKPKTVRKKAVRPSFHGFLSFISSFIR